LDKPDEKAFFEKKNENTGRFWITVRNHWLMGCTSSRRRPGAANVAKVALHRDADDAETKEPTHLEHARATSGVCCRMASHVCAMAMPIKSAAVPIKSMVMPMTLTDMPCQDTAMPGCAMASLQNAIDVPGRTTAKPELHFS
jgi:hypothetical protein